MEALHDVDQFGWLPQQRERAIALAMEQSRALSARKVALSRDWFTLSNHSLLHVSKAAG